jgi:hypothetical protein
MVLAATATLVAQVPVTEDPRYRVAFANAQWRILHLNLPPGDTSLDHRHDFDVATISMSDGSNTREQLSGQPWGKPRPSRPRGNASATEYTGKAASHRVENLGKSPYQLFAVENLRKGGWSATPALTARATKLTAESRAFRIYDVRLGRETVQTSHTHAQPTIVVSIAGAVISDGPDKQAKTFAPAAVGLKQLTQPGEWLLVPPGDTHHVVRLGVADAHLVEIEVR